MKHYEDLMHISENREPQRAYYIPENEGAYTLLNGEKVNIYRAEKAVLTDEESAVLENAVVGEVLSDKPKRGLLVKCADGAVKLLEVQAAGGKRISGGDFLNGRKAQKGQVFTC